MAALGVNNYLTDSSSWSIVVDPAQRYDTVTWSSNPFSHGYGGTLVVPPALEGTARQMLDQAYNARVDTQTLQMNPMYYYEPLAGEIRVVPEKPKPQLTFAERLKQVCV